LNRAEFSSGTIANPRPDHRHPFDMGRFEDDTGTVEDGQVFFPRRPSDKVVRSRYQCLVPGAAMD
jgi:hypothetical protein